MQEQIFNMLVNKDEITWQSIIYDLVKSEQMDPWDIDIALLAQEYLEKVREMQEHNFFISGKVILASAIMLKLKSVKFVDEHIAGFDTLLFSREEDLLYDEEQSPFAREEIPPLLLKTPQQRKRKVDLQDLMEALNAALRVEEKRMIRKLKERPIREVVIPERKIDIGKLIKEVYNKIISWFTRKQKLTFTELTNGSRNRQDVLLTFVPLLHLSNQQKIDLEQEVPFGEISIILKKEAENENNKQN
ncbi:MAG: segregation/condensation protein A [Nanoarchaeota archaeon]